ncbi:hypothetical protein ACFWIQ_36270 [Kitasatospora sp. NPDC127059]|uniref:hypothetical protein n=1 Tax=Kitasatospora sp. NPDC127059 TaxID=3347120 RepID=UPI00364B2356
MFGRDRDPEAERRATRNRRARQATQADRAGRAAINARPENRSTTAWHSAPAPRRWPWQSR